MRNTLELVLGLFDDDEVGSKLGELENCPEDYGFQLIYSERGNLVFKSEADIDKIVVRDDLQSLNGLQIKYTQNSNVVKEGKETQQDIDDEGRQLK
jgi:hypothetical protein